MYTLKAFRNFVDKLNSYEELIPVIQEILTSPITLEFGNSLLHALSFLNEEYLTYEEWSELYLSLQKKLDLAEFNETTYNSMIKLFCSPFGYQHLMEIGDFEQIINRILEEMDFHDFPFRRRTLTHIFQVAHTQKLPILSMQVYLTSQVRNIALAPSDLVYVLITVPNSVRYNVIYDIIGLNKTFQTPELTLLQSSFTSQEYKETNGKINGELIPPFRLNKKEHSQVLDALRSHVDHITHSRKGLLKTYDQFIKKLRKMNYSVVIDGANVGRFNQGTKSQGDINFDQIKLLVEVALHKNESVIVFLNENHLKSVRREYAPTLQYLQENTLVYPTPKGLDDDLFWLYASMANPNALLITNDELRNHIHRINGSFQRWKEYKRITYNINREKTSVKLVYPCAFEVKPFYNKEQRKLYVPGSQKDWYGIDIK